MSGVAITAPRRFRRWSWWLPVSVALAAAAGAMAWFLTGRSASSFIEYPMLAKTDIPTAVDATPDGAVWFTIEFSNAIGFARNGKIERIRKESQNFEPLGLAADGAGGAWYTDAPISAISHISPDGKVRSFPLPAPIARLGRLAASPDGAIWFADLATASVTRLQNGSFTRYDVGSEGATPFGVAIEKSGTVWTTLQGTDQVGRISNDGQVTTFDPPTRNSGLGDIAVDGGGAVWFLELRANKVGRFAGGRFTEFTVPTPSAGLTALAAAPDGSAWFTELSVGKLGRVQGGRVKEFPLPRAGARPFGVAVDAANNVWYSDLSGWLGMLPASQARAP